MKKATNRRWRYKKHLIIYRNTSRKWQIVTNFNFLRLTFLRLKVKFWRFNCHRFPIEDHREGSNFCFMSFLYCLRTYHSRQNITVITLAGQTISSASLVLFIKLEPLICYCNVTIYAYINTLFEEQQQQQSLIIIDQANESLSTGLSWNISVLLRWLTIFLLKVHGVFEEAVNPIKWKREDDAK